MNKRFGKLSKIHRTKYTFFAHRISTYKMYLFYEFIVEETILLYGIG